MKRFAYFLISIALAAGLLRPSYAQAPATTTISEALFGSRTGAEKKESALAFISAALSMTEAIANRDVVDEDKFRDGLSKIIDGVVECLNASAWAKSK